jgi:hypothetical protein
MRITREVNLLSLLQKTSDLQNLDSRASSGYYGRIFYILLSIILSVNSSFKPEKESDFKVIAFYSARNDKAHISFVKEAKSWFSGVAANNGFVFDTTRNWNDLNPEFLSGYRIVIFLDSRPESTEQREAFREYMEKGGAWMGFHFAAFALTPSAIPDNWEWYQDQFLGCGAYTGNTWRPTSALLRVEHRKHPATKKLPQKFISSPNEWYKWENDLRMDKDIEILLSVDPSSFPLGTGPKKHEIWHDGYYPVAWTNRNYKMVYINMGHNDIDYETGTNRELSFTFTNKFQNRFVLDCLFWLSGR